MSYYAFFKGWLLLSQPPSCLCLPTSFPSHDTGVYLAVRIDVAGAAVGIVADGQADDLGVAVDARRKADMDA